MVAQLFPSAFGIVKRWAGGSGILKAVDYVPPYADGELYAGYSFRLLRSGYSGPCVRLRRSTDNVEQDFGFLGGWLDIAAVSAWLGAASGKIVTLYDQSGSARHTYQGVAASQPTIVLTSSPFGRPTATFAGSTLQSDPFGVVNQPFSFLLHSRWVGSGSWRPLSLDDGTVADASVRTYPPSPGTFGIWATNLTGLGTAISTPFSLGVVVNTTLSRYVRESGVINNVSINSAGQMRGVRIGSHGAFTHNGDVSEVLVFNSALSITDIQSRRANTAAAYGEG